MRNKFLSTLLLCIIASGVLADSYTLPAGSDYVHSFEVHNGPVSGLALFEEEDILVTTGIADKLTKVWKLSDQTLLQTFSDHTETLKGVIPLKSEDGSKTYFATFSFDKTIRVYDVKTLKLVHILTGTPERVTRAVHVKGTNFLVTASVSELRVWNFVEGGRAAQVIDTEHGDLIRGLVYISKTNYVATTAWDNKIKIWDTETGELFKTIPYTGKDKIYCLYFAEHLNLLVTADMEGVIYRWKWEKGINTFVYQDYGGFFPIDMLAIPNSNILIVAGFQSKEIKFLDIEKYNTKVKYEKAGSTNEIWRLEYIKNTGYFLSTGADYSVRKWPICQTKNEYFNIEHGICVQDCVKKDVSKQVCFDPVNKPEPKKQEAKKTKKTSDL